MRGRMPVDGQDLSAKLILLPGHVLLIEQEQTALSADAAAAFAGAHVVIYDPALAPFVGEALPLGSYAEPWSPDPQAAGPVLAPRAVKFAADGWSVVQLVAARPPIRERLARIAAANGSNYPPARRLAASDDGGRLSLVFGPVGPGHPVEGHAFTANGLAG